MKSRSLPLVSPNRNEDFRRRQMTQNEKLWFIVLFIATADFLFSLYTLDIPAMVTTLFIFTTAIFAILEF